MVKNTKPILALLILLLITQSFLILGVTAQGQATVNVLESVGGSTDPLPGTYNYTDGQQVTLTATPSQDLVFVTWLISSDTSNETVADNPYTFTVTGGTTYTVSVVFAQLAPTPTFPNPPGPEPATYGSISILSAVGGRTEPAAGTYYFTSVYKLKMRAIPNNGWQFSHWTISGDTNTTHGGYPFTTTPTDNPYTFDCGIGYTYSYQPVFAPAGNQTGTPGGGTSTSLFGLTTELIIIIALIVIIVILLIGFGVVLTRRRRP
ncbi:MAG TPA: hypothetical protein VK209_02530 [Candidatus Sulfotelmatobacter sp.]|nr:hypothetical protein [Candidatus Sulfotelmatobacter sp.]